MSVQEVSKKGSQVLDKSAKNANSVAESAAKVLSEVSSQLVTQIAALANVVQETEYAAQRKEQIEAENAQKERDAKIELDFKVRENETGTLNVLLKKAGLVGVTQASIDELVKERDHAQTLANRTEYEAVVAKEKELKSQFNLEKVTTDAKHNQEIAVLKAANEQYAKTEALQDAQIQELKEQIAANREAEIKREEARSKAAGTTINNAK